MTIASITTDINIGPYKIPSNAQNMIMNNYAQRNNITIEIVIPEPIMSNQLATTIWLHKEFNFSQIILCSFHQLPQDNKYFKRILDNFKKTIFHFAIEGLMGEGYDFLKKSQRESNFFNTTKIIDSSKTNWLKLFDDFKKTS